MKINPDINGDIFDVADAILQEVYPNWGASHIPNQGILRGRIARLVRDLRQQCDKAEAKLNAIKKLDRHNPKFFHTLNVDVNWVVSNEDLKKILEG